MSPGLDQHVLDEALRHRSPEYARWLCYSLAFSVWSEAAKGEFAEGKPWKLSALRHEEYKVEIWLLEVSKLRH